MFGLKKSMDKTQTESPPAEPTANPVEIVPLSPEQIEDLKTRAAREKIEAGQYASFSLIQKLLPVLDNFEMALTAAQTAQGDKLASLQSGVLMIQQQLKSALTETGLEEIDATGNPFDPAWHEAISQQESADVPEDHVAQQLRKGYKFKDRLLRAATVIVAKKPAENSK